MENGRSSILSFANRSWSHDFLVFIVILLAYVIFVIVFGDTKWATSVIPIIERVSRFIPTAIVLTIVIETLRHKIMGLIRDLLREEDRKKLEQEIRDSVVEETRQKTLEETNKKWEEWNERRIIAEKSNQRFFDPPPSHP
jgi:divalent metal cation (Fe/Co/Zn/Cd) transporter